MNYAFAKLVVAWLPGSSIFYWPNLLPVGLKTLQLDCMIVSYHTKHHKGSKIVGSKRIQYLCEGRIEKSVPRDHRMSSLGKPRDAKW